MIYGRVTEAGTRSPAAHVRVRIVNTAANVDLETESGADGAYTFLLLPPGTYWMRLEAPKDAALQPAEVHELSLPVAGALEQPVALRRLSDAFEQSRLSQLPVPGSDQLVRFYGPDLDLSRVAYVNRWETDIRISEPSVSAVIDAYQIQELPLLGQDVFSLLVLQPAVASDSATARSLGLAANGIRPASSNFLVDGVEFNNYLVGGPIVALPPDSVQEYRISTNVFSAEYGGTAGYLANAITRTGTSNWHGLTYLDTKNEWLNANDFQNTVVSVPRPRLREYRAGYDITGPVFPRFKKKLFVSFAGEYFRSDGEQPDETFTVPSAGFLQSLQSFPEDAPARVLLNSYPPPQSTPIPGDPFLGTARLRPAVVVKRPFFMNRLDGVANSWRYYLRILDARLEQPDFIWSPYPDFISGLSQGTDGVVAGFTVTPTARSAAETKLAISKDSIGWDRAHPEVPTLLVLAGNPGTGNPVLPGSPAAYSYAYRGRSIELNSSLLIALNRHVIKFGASVLQRSLHTDLPYAQSGAFSFSSIGSLETLADPNGIRFYPVLDRAALSVGHFEVPQFDRQYQYLQGAAYIQDSYSLSRRVVLNFGLRMDYSGAPVNVGPNKDTLVELGTGDTFVERLSNANLVQGSSGHQTLYDPKATNFAVRASFAINLSKDTTSPLHTVLRGGYGTFYDRPLENAWLNISNNSFVFPAAGIVVPNGTNFLNGPQAQLTSLAPQIVPQDFPSLTLVQPGLPNGYAQDLFLKLQRQFSTHLFVDSGLQASLGRHLLTQDVINRQSDYNPQLPALAYLSSQGTSEYYAWATSVNYRTSRALISVAYTWSHAIDNQSDPLSGNFFDLSFSSDPTRIQQRAGFSQEFNSRIDRGNADFDQRHNLAVASIWNLPALPGSTALARATKGWKLSQMAALRSGLPFTVFDAIAQPEQGAPLLTRRADVVNPAEVWLSPALGVPGGEMLLNPDAFCRAPSCVTDRTKQGNAGRNAFRGPGLVNVDASLSKFLPLAMLGEAGGITFRADAFNLLNHANLGQPDSNLTSGTFGIASYGRQGNTIGFPAVAPFRETGRQVQVVLKVEF